MKNRATGTRNTLADLMDHLLMAIEAVEDAETPDEGEFALKKAKVVDHAGQTIVSAAVTMLYASSFCEEATDEMSIPRQLGPRSPTMQSGPRA